MQQVKNEVQIQSICGHHPFIVNCPFFWQSRNQLFIGEYGIHFNQILLVIKYYLYFSVSDYIGGGELLQLLQKYGPLPETLCRIYFAELVVIIGIVIIFLKYIF